MLLDFDQARDFLKKHPRVSKEIHNTTRTFGFELKDGRHIAIKPLKTQITVFAEPGDWELMTESQWGIKAYAASKGRSSNLKQCAPRLDVGNTVVSLSLKSNHDFEKFFSVYLA